MNLQANMAPQISVEKMQKQLVGLIFHILFKKIYL